MASTERAKALYVEGVTATANLGAAIGARLLRAALVAGVDGADRGRVLLSLAHAEAEQGRVELGLRLLDEAESLLPQSQLGVLYGQRGLYLLRTGKNDAALPELDRAISLLSEQSAPEDLAKVLLNRGNLQLGSARRSARQDLTRCAQLAAAHGLERIAAKASHNLAYLDYLAGDLPTALGRYSMLARQYAVLAPSALPVLAVDKARALLAAGLFGEADRELAGALEQFRDLRLSQDYAEAELARAEAALLGGRPSAARAWATRAKGHFQRRANARWATLAELVVLQAEMTMAVRLRTLPARALSLAETLRALGLVEDARLANLIAVRALVAIGRVGIASDELAKCPRPRPGGRLSTHLLWRLTRAEVATGLGQRNEASRQRAAGLAELHRHRSHLGSLDLQTGTGVLGRDLAEAGLHAALTDGSVTAVYRWAERARAQALLLSAVRPPADADAVALLEDLRESRGALRQAELAGKPAGNLRARCDALQRELREHSWRTAGTSTAARYAPLSAVRTELADAAMVVYLRDAQRLRALVILQGRTRVVDLGLYADAENALLRLRADLDASAGRAMPRRLAETVAAATRNDSEVLAKAILSPILGLIGNRDLVVVPTGVLVTVPWAILPGCAKRPVTVAMSATTWCAARNRLRAVADNSASATILLVAGPGNDRGEAELRAIAALRANATILTGASATPAATLAGLSQVTIAHLAAHGRHEADNALFSALELTGGPLMGYDLQRLDSTPPTVVLSCCDLGLSDVRPGDETLGMVTALLSVGSSTVVASVGQIGDETAMAVMSAYHKGICDGLPSATALADAVGQSATDSEASAASFVCFGSG